MPILARSLRALPCGSSTPRRHADSRAPRGLNHKIRSKRQSVDVVASMQRTKLRVRTRRIRAHGIVEVPIRDAPRSVVHRLDAALMGVDGALVARWLWKPEERDDLRAGLGRRIDRLRLRATKLRDGEPHHSHAEDDADTSEHKRSRLRTWCRLRLRTRLGRGELDLFSTRLSPAIPKSRTFTSSSSEHADLVDRRDVRVRSRSRAWPRARIGCGVRERSRLLRAPCLSRSWWTTEPVGGEGWHVDMAAAMGSVVRDRGTRIRSGTIRFVTAAQVRHLAKPRPVPARIVCAFADGRVDHVVLRATGERDHDNERRSPHHDPS